MTSDPVIARTLTAVTPTIERGYRHAEQLRNLEQCHEPFAALEPAGLACWRTSYFGRRRSLPAGREWHEPSLSLCSIEPALVIGKRWPEICGHHAMPIGACNCQKPEGARVMSASRRRILVSRDAQLPLCHRRHFRLA
jgi:hypothetical protein